MTVRKDEACDNPAHHEFVSLQDTGLEDVLERTAEVLRRGGLAVIPTETVYGLAADPRVETAQARIRAAKGRDPLKPIPLLAAGQADVEAFGARFCDEARALAERFWPGPLTLVLDVGEGDAHGALANEGFRVPAYEPTLALLRRMGGLLRVSSANLSGEPPALTGRDAARLLGGTVDIVMDVGHVPGGVPSTVVRCEAGKLNVLREGALSEKQLVEAIGQGSE